MNYDIKLNIDVLYRKMINPFFVTQILCFGYAEFLGKYNRGKSSEQQNYVKRKFNVNKYKKKNTRNVSGSG